MGDLDLNFHQLQNRKVACVLQLLNDFMDHLHDFEPLAIRHCNTTSLLRGNLEISNKLQIIRRADLRYMVDADKVSRKDATAAESEAIDLLAMASAKELSQDRRVIYEGL